jgi:hypothetical protein
MGQVVMRMVYVLRISLLLMFECVLYDVEAGFV